MHGAAARDRGRERHHAAVRLHQEALLGADAGVVEAAIEMIDVVHQHWLEVGIEQRGREPRPFADARQHLARQRHMHAREFLVDEAARRLLVRGVHEREQVADRDRVDARNLELTCRGAHGRLIERQEHVAEIIRPFGDFPGEALRRDRLRLGVEIVEQIAVARLVLHLLHRAVAFGDEEPDLGAAHLQQRIGGDGGAVSEKTDVSGRDALGNESPEPLEHAQRGIFRRARDLLD